jgi:CHAT domain-containing protein
MAFKLDTYFNLLIEALQITQDSKGDPQVVYPFLQENLDKLDNNLAKVLRDWATTRLISVNQETGRSIAGTISSFSHLIQDFPLGNPHNNLEIAFTGYEVVSAVFTQQECPQAWAEIQLNLCRAYFKKNYREPTQNLDKAIVACQSALEVYTCEDSPEEWAATQINLGNIYFLQVYGDPKENLTKAIDSYQKASEVFEIRNLSEQWETAQNNLVTADLGWNSEESFEQAIRAYKLALKTRRRKVFPEKWAETQNNLCIAYRSRILGNPARNLKLAIIHGQLALQVRTREAFPEQWADTQNNLGNAYCERIQGNTIENLWLAVEAYQEALGIYTRRAFPQKWARTQGNLGTAYSELRQLTLAIECFRSALEIYTPTAFPVECLIAGRNFGFTAYQFGDMDKAIEGYGVAIEAVEQSREWVRSDSRKEEILSGAIDVYGRIVQAYLRNNQLDKAIEYVERSKARNLVGLLANKNIYPKRDLYPNPDTYQTHSHQLDHLRQEIPAQQRELERLISAPKSEERYGEKIERRRQELNHLQQQRDELLSEINQIDDRFTFTQKVEPIPFSDIQALINDSTAIIEWYIVDNQIITFIITSQSPGIKVWTSTSAELHVLIVLKDEYLQDLQSNRHRWQKLLPARLKTLANILHLNHILTLIPETCNQLILIPHRFLHLFPLHALPLANGDFLCDRFSSSVGYAPSCQLLQLTQKRDRPDFSNFFAIQNPTDNLLYTNLEVETISSSFPSAKVLVKQEATKIAVNASLDLPLAHCNHFSCHGEFNLTSPLESALILANEERLTLGEIFGLSLNQCRLVTLSACETGLTDPTSISDEYIGLPSGFLYAGTATVVSSLWAVKDLSTAFLMLKFYENFQSSQKQAGDVAVALNQAQKWLRNLTIEKLDQFLNQHQPQLDQVLAQLRPGQRSVFQESLKQIRQRQPLPFANLYYWAAFAATGL